MDFDTGESSRGSKRRRHEDDDATVSGGENADDSCQEIMSVTGSETLDRSFRESSIVEIDQEPVIIFAREKRLYVEAEIVDTAVGNVWRSKGYLVFQRPQREGLGTTHFKLLNGIQLSAVVNDSVPQEYQGTGYFAVTVEEEVMSTVKNILEILKDDGNRTWAQRTRTWCHFEQKGRVVNVMVVYYTHAVQGFCKTISFTVDSPNSIEPALNETNIAVIRYYWGKGATPASFDPRTYRESKLPSFYKEKFAAKYGKRVRGPTIAPRHALQEVIEETPSVLIRTNPSFQVSSVRQAKTAKQSSKYEQYGRDKLQYLLDCKAVETHFYQCLDVGKSETKIIKRKVHFICHPYQLDLLAKCAFGPDSTCVDIDVKFRLTDAYAVVMTCRLRDVVHKERRTPLTFFGLIAITEKKDEDTFAEIALWLHSQMIKRGKKITYEDPKMNLKIKTDDEVALYTPFINIFKAVHVLCTNHLSSAYERNMKSRNASLNLIHAWQRRLFGDPDRENGTYTSGTVDEETVEAMIHHVRTFERANENPDVLNWLVESRNGIKKLHSKVGPAVRRLAGIYPDLPHTNVVEGMNNLLGIESGKNGIGQCELVDRLDNLLKSRCEEICRSLMELGDYESLDEQHLIRRSDRNNAKVVAVKLKEFFGADPDPERVLSIWKGVSRNKTVTDFDSTLLGRQFQEAKLEMHHKAAFVRAVHYELNPNKIVMWPVADNVSATAVRHFGVLSEKDLHQQYHVSIEEETGQYECRCAWFLNNGHRLCKHVAAAASAHDLMSVVTEYTKHKALSNNLTFSIVPGGGKKLSQRSAKTGKGFTVRKDLDRDPDDHPQAAMVKARIVDRDRSTGGCPCRCDASKPWQKGTSAFIITNEEKFSALCCCPGCKVIMKNKTDSRLMVTREEFEFRSGTGGKVVTPTTNKRRYCMQLGCIRQRHPKFEPNLCKLDKAVTFSAEELDEISDYGFPET